MDRGWRLSCGRWIFALLAAGLALSCWADSPITWDASYTRGTQNYRDWLQDQQSGVINEDTPQQRDGVGLLLRRQYPGNGNCVGCLWEFLMYAMSEIPSNHATHARPEEIRVGRKDGRIYIVQFLGPAPERRVLYEFYPDAPQNASGERTGVLFRINGNAAPADANYRVPQKLNPSGNRGFGELLDMQGADLAQARSALARFSFLPPAVPDTTLPLAPTRVDGGGSPLTARQPALRVHGDRAQTAQAGDLYWRGTLLMRRGTGGPNTDQEHGWQAEGGVVFVHGGNAPGADGRHTLQAASWHLYTMPDPGGHMTHLGGYGTHIEIVMNDSSLRENGTRVNLTASLHNITVEGQPQPLRAFRYVLPPTMGTTPLFQFVTAEGHRYDTRVHGGGTQVVHVDNNSRPFATDGTQHVPAPVIQPRVQQPSPGTKLAQVTATLQTLLDTSKSEAERFAALELLADVVRGNEARGIPRSVLYALLGLRMGNPSASSRIAYLAGNLLDSVDREIHNQTSDGWGHGAAPRYITGPAADYIDSHFAANPAGVSDLSETSAAALLDRAAARRAQAQAAVNGLATGDGSAARTSINALPVDEALRALTAALKSDNATIRARAAEMLGQARYSGHAAWGDMLRAALQFGEAPARILALQILGARGGRYSVEPVAALLADSDKDVRLAAIGALRAMGASGGLDPTACLERMGPAFTVLRTMMNSASEDMAVRRAAAQALVALLAADNPMRQQAQTFLESGPPFGAAELSTLLSNVRNVPESQTLAAVQALARSALAPAGPRTPEVINHLLAAATQRYYSLDARRAAVTALVDIARQHPGQISPSVVQALAAMLPASNALANIKEADRAALRAHIRVELGRLGSLGDLDTLASAPGDRLSRFTATFQAAPHGPYGLWATGAQSLGITTPQGATLWRYTGNRARSSGDTVAQLPNGDILRLDPDDPATVYRFGADHHWTRIGRTAGDGAITDAQVLAAAQAIRANRTARNWQQPPSLAQDLATVNPPLTSNTTITDEARAGAVRRLLNADSFPSSQNAALADALARYLHRQSIYPPDALRDLFNMDLESEANRDLFMEALKRLMDMATADPPTVSRASINTIWRIYYGLPTRAGGADGGSDATRRIYTAFRESVRNELNRLSAGDHGFRHDSHDLAYYVTSFGNFGQVRQPPQAALQAWNTWLSRFPE